MDSLHEISRARSYVDRSSKKVEPIKINSINDIKKAIIPFMKERSENKVNFTSEVKWKDEDGNEVITKVSAHSTDPDLRQSLLDGFKQVDEQQKLWDNIHNVLEEDEYGSSLPPVDINDFEMPVDRLIRHRLGGKRNGHTIVWYINNQKIVFNPFTKSLDII